MSKKRRLYSKTTVNNTTIEEEDMSKDNNVNTEDMNKTAGVSNTAGNKLNVEEEQKSNSNVVTDVPKPIVPPTAKEPIVKEPVVASPSIKEEATSEIKDIEEPSKPMIKQTKVTSATSIVDSIDPDMVIANAKASKTNLRILAGIFTNYATSMAPGRAIEPKAGANNQYNLYRAIVQILNMPSYDDFKAGMILLLAVCIKHRDGCFSDRYIYRFAEEWTASVDKLVSFQATINLLMTIVNTKERPISKYVDLQKKFNTGYSETARENITKFIS